MFFFIVPSSSSQTTIPTQNGTDQLITKITSKGGGRYRYQSKIYTKKELRHIIEKDKLAWNYYRHYERTKKNSKIGRITGGTLFILSIIQFSNWNIDEFKAPDEKKKARRLVILSLGSCGVGIFALSERVSSNKFLNKSIDSFNRNLNNKQSLGITPIQLNLQSTQNGIGLVLNF